MEQEQRKGTTNADAEIVKAILYCALGLMAIFAAIYIVIFALFGGAIYLGAKLGMSDLAGSKPKYKTVKELEDAKRKHLAELEGESEELRELIEGKYEQDKMELYREDTRPEPLINIDLDAVKSTVKRVIQAVRGTRE